MGASHENREGALSNVVYELVDSVRDRLNYKFIIFSSHSHI